MRTLAAILLGGWLIGSIVVGAAAAQNFYMIDKLLNSVESPRPFLNITARMESGEARGILRFLVSELNRYYFRTWEWVEILFGAILLFLAFKYFGDKKLIIGFAVMLGIVLLMSFYVTPQMIDVGRKLDFVPRDPAPPELSWFGKLHGLYSVLYLIMLVIGIWMSVLLAKIPDLKR